MKPRTCPHCGKVILNNVVFNEESSLLCTHCSKVVIPATCRDDYPKHKPASHLVGYGGYGGYGVLAGVGHGHTSYDPDDES